MENREIVAAPVPEERPLNAKPRDFEPLQTTNNPLPDDRPTSPPVCSYDLDTSQPGDCPDSAEK